MLPSSSCVRQPLLELLLRRAALLPQRRNALLDFYDVLSLLRAIGAERQRENAVHLRADRVDGRLRCFARAVNGLEAVSAAHLSELVCDLKVIGEEDSVEGLIGLVWPANPKKTAITTSSTRYRRGPTMVLRRRVIPSGR